MLFSAVRILGGRRSTGQARRSVVPSPVEILLVSGLHPYEACAPLMARAVFRRLYAQGERIALYEVPGPFTWLALIDDPAVAVTTYSMPAERRRLDVDLDGLDELLGRRYPGALVFEFHNSEDTQPMLGIDPARSVNEYEVGEIGPGSERPYEIGCWRNLDDNGRPGKYLIEVPACFAPVDPTVRERRRLRLAELAAAGYEYDPRWSHYLESEVDIEASRRKGYLDDYLVQKIADWIIGRREARHSPGLRLEQTRSIRGHEWPGNRRVE
jgi:hypothetical protein